MDTTQPFPTPQNVTVPLGKSSLPTTSDSHLRLDELVEATRKLFPGELAVTTESDPEYPELTFTILSVRAQGDIESIVDRESRWVALLNELAPGVPGIRLEIDPRP